MFFSIKLKKIKISPTKLNKYLLLLKNLSLSNILFKVKLFPIKIKILLVKLIKYFNFNKNNSNKQNYILIQIFANRNSISKKIQPRAKGKTFFIQKKLSNLNLYFCKKKLYKSINFIKLLINI